MTASLIETEAMRRAIAVSAFGIGMTSPNPPVGCLILNAAGRSIGAGYHLRKGEPHAEVNALIAAGQRARGGTAVVTLEPCNHAGVTPACRQALLDAGISRVLIAIMDPTSRGEGGAAVLRAAGVDVEIGVLEQEAMTVLGDWLHAQRVQRPVITWAIKTDSTGTIGDSAEIARWRAQFDLVAIGAELVEGVPGGHGRFEVPSSGVLNNDAATALKIMFDCGARTLLIIGDSPLNRALLAADMVDRIQVDVARPAASADPVAWPVPAEFVLAAANPSPSAVTYTFARTAIGVRGR